jgi:hypothetical protein
MDADGSLARAPSRARAGACASPGEQWQLLKDHRKRQLEERMRLAGLCQDQDLIFPNEIGSLLNPSNLRNRSFKRIKMRSGVREAHPHFFPPRASPREPLMQILYSHKESLEGSFEKRPT